MPKRPLAPEEKVRRQVKRLNSTIEQLMAEMATKGYFSGAAKARGITIPIRVIVRAKNPNPECWAMSIITDRRIDGIDWHTTVYDHRGPKHNCKGWHRHIWKRSNGADDNRECLPSDFSPASIAEFVVGGFGILRVQLMKESTDDARGQLRLYKAGTS